MFVCFNLQQVFPEWNVLDVFVIDDLQNVFRSDSTNRTRPMTHYVESAQEVAWLFDNIAYAKCKYCFGHQYY